jgi:type I site-specific restriction endonuclease
LVPVVGTCYNEGQQVFKQISETFVKDPELKALVIKSKYGSGKTTFLRQLMESQQYKRVLFITYRQTLARDIMRNFEALGVANYLDAYEKPRTWDSERLIVQYDSLMKVMTNNTKYMITDEFNA